MEFHSNREPTLGIELELGLVDAQTMALSSSIQTILEQVGEGNSAATYKPELMQCCVEINTGICKTVSDAADDLSAKIVCQNCVPRTNL